MTVAVAFDAGSRVERSEESGIAHFLEHLVFKGGRDHPTYREVNAASERLGARTNAFTSAEVVAFWIVARSDRMLEAADLLTDFTARPRLDSVELDKERGVVVQEIARSHDQPSARADELINRASFGDHPLGRSILGTEESLCSIGRDEVISFRQRRWAGSQGGVFLVGDPAALADGVGIEELFGRYPAIEPPGRPEPVPPPRAEAVVEHRESSQSHLRLAYRAAIDMGDPAARAALIIYSTLLGGSAGSRLFDEIREQRGLAYSVRAGDYPLSDAAVVELSAGLESGRTIEAHERMREIVAELAAEGPTEEEVARARSFAAGNRVISLESTIAVARAAIEEHVVFGSSVDPDEMIARLDTVTGEDIAAVARSVTGEPAVACVGPHQAGEFGGLGPETIPVTTPPGEISGDAEDKSPQVTGE